MKTARHIIEISAVVEVHYTGQRPGEDQVRSELEKGGDLADGLHDAVLAAYEGAHLVAHQQLTVKVGGFRKTNRPTSSRGRR